MDKKMEKGANDSLIKVYNSECEIFGIGRCPKEVLQLEVPEDGFSSGRMSVVLEFTATRRFDIEEPIAQLRVTYHDDKEELELKKFEKAVGNYEKPEIMSITFGIDGKKGVYRVYASMLRGNLNTARKKGRITVTLLMIK